ncbi:uncharacterized protein EAF02_010440 [Botrytis sinoallii]|uniref:uncharacterized protein n=1 Tax=Botrytis sinoallii TaxID=1463999 RepID=UPI001901E666|nr:uncharacterized protein EAF02_010440 [Botrytis sinoallii]KAF7862891.1 hypothetical protein EAF02_010440 [Botrytis sinoallii]
MPHYSSLFFESITKRKLRLAMTRPTPNARGVKTFTTGTVTVRLDISSLHRITHGTISNTLGIVMDNQAPGSYFFMDTYSRKSSPISTPILIPKWAFYLPAEHFTSLTYHQLISSDTALKKYNRAYDTTYEVSVLPGSSESSRIIQSVFDIQFLIQWCSTK